MREVLVVVRPTPAAPPAASGAPPGTRAQVAAQSAGARLALGQAARGSQCPVRAWTKDSRGAFLPRAGWCASITHDGDLVAGTVDRAPVGVDLERIAARRPRLVRKVLSAEELTRFDGIEPDLAFIRAWTAKEAVLKAAGVGIAELSLARVLRVVDDQRLLLTHRGRPRLVEQVRWNDHVLAVYASAPGWTVRWELDPTPLALEAPRPGSGQGNEIDNG